MHILKKKNKKKTKKNRNRLIDIGNKLMVTKEVSRAVER